MSFLDRRFELAAHGTTAGTEALAGLTTFLTMASIVFVQPALLSAAGMDFGAVLVATMMMGGLRHIDWADPTEAVPAFLTVIMMPLAVSITEGVAFGVIAHVALKLAAGRGKTVYPLLYVFAALFLLRYAFLR